MNNDKGSILVVDDEPVVRDSLMHWFTEDGYQVDCATSAEDALQRLASRNYDLLLVDIRMPGMDGMELQRRLKDADCDSAVIVMTGYASVETAVAALKQGAFDYITKPFDPDEFSAVVRKALEHQRLKRENRVLREVVELAESGSELIGQSEAMRRVDELIRTVAPTDATVLIEGESGTGKELVARAIHRMSRRRLLPMVVIHCGALTETLIESELFGHEKGAFTGAQYRKKGKFEVAAGGTVFLDEISDISLKTQTDLLRVLQEREIVRVGGTQPMPVDFRAVAATNKNLEALVKEGAFRSDLFYRLNVFQIALPPLRDRRSDLPLLAGYFLKRFNEQMNRRFAGLDAAALEVLTRYPWPGNVRQLENAVERAMVVGKEPLLKASDFSVGETAAEAPEVSLDAVERRHILRTLEQFNWNQTHAARALGIDRVTLYHKINRYGLRSVAPKNVPKLAVVEIGDLPAGLLDEITPGVGRILGLDPGPRSRLDPAFAYDERRRQYLAAALLGRLRELTPDDTLVVGAAAVDLFIPILTFVFGEAEMPGRAAVFSIHRLHEEFYGLPPDHSLLAGRAAKEMLHELGHTFGLAHCPDYACAMSSSPSVEAVDLKGNALCNGCLRRLKAGGASAICRVPPREVWPPFPKG